MIYLLFGLLVVQVIINGLIIYGLVKQGREERQSLEMKLLAVCNPPAAVHVESVEKGGTGSVTYMDDAEMVRREKTTS